MKLTKAEKSEYEDDFIEEIKLSNSTPTCLRLSKENRSFLKLLSKDYNRSINFIVNRIMYQERNQIKFKSNFYKRIKKKKNI